MQTIPGELYEAARVDGANAWQRFGAVTFPGIRQVVIITTLLSSIWTANAFENVWLLTQGGPSDATMVFPVLAYFGMQTQRLGEAASVSVAMLPVLVILVFAATAMSQRGDGRVMRRAAQLCGAGGRGLARAVPALLDGDHLAQAAARDLPHALAVAAGFTLNNYRVLLGDKGFLLNVWNSFVVSAAVTLISILLSSFAAYSMVRFRTRFRGLIGRVILFAYLTPTSLLFIPLSILMARLQMGNSLQGLVLVYLTFALPLGTWLLQGYFRGVPRELEEQGDDRRARRGIGALFRIVLPLSAPGLAAVAIFTFTGAWNELLLALVLITSDGQRTAPLALNYLITSDVLPWGPLMAGAVISSLPLVVLYFFAQRFMVQGLTAGSVKG